MVDTSRTSPLMFAICPASTKSAEGPANVVFDGGVGYGGVALGGDDGGVAENALDDG